MAEYTIYIYNHYNDHVSDKELYLIYNIADITYILLIIDSYIHVYMYVK